MPAIVENNPQKFRALELFKASLDEATGSGKGGRIIFPEDLPFSKGRIVPDWTPPVVAYRESLANPAGKP